MKKLLSFLIVAVFSVAPFVSNAQDDPPGDDPGGDPGVPIDGGLSLLMAAGAGYVTKKIYDKRKKASELSHEDVIEK